MREFTTAVEEVTEESSEAPVEFLLDGTLLRAYKPTPGQLAMLSMSLGRHTDDPTKLAGIIDFFITVMDDDSHRYLVDRLMSREDALGFNQVQEITEWLMEEWTGRPTQPLSVSTR